MSRQSMMMEILDREFDRLRKQYEDLEGEVRARLIKLYHPDDTDVKASTHYLNCWPEMHLTGFAHLASIYPGLRTSAAYDIVGLAVTGIINDALEDEKEGIEYEQ